MNKKTWTKEDQVIFEIIDKGLLGLREHKQLSRVKYRNIMKMLCEEDEE